MQTLPSNPPQSIDSQSYDGSRRIFKLLQANMNTWQEEAWVISLNSQLQIIRLNLLFRGTADWCPMHPRDIFRILISDNASNFVFAHNHPSGNIKASREDIRITERLQKAGQLMQIPLIDHLVFSSVTYYSFADAGRLRPDKKSPHSQITDSL